MAVGDQAGGAGGHQGGGWRWFFHREVYVAGGPVDVPVDCALAEWWQFAAHVRDLASQLVCTLVRGMDLASTLTTLQPSPIRPAYAVGGLGVSH